jgi:rhodanese-related sulfurtransferase
MTGMSEIPQIASTDVHDHAVILDVREQDEWDAGHAPGAVHIPLGELPTRLDELPDTDSGTLAVTCRGGGRSSRAVAWLSQQGFDVANLDGGMKGWHAAGKPVVSESGQPQVI